MNLSLNTVSLKKDHCDGARSRSKSQNSTLNSFDLNDLKNGFAKYFENSVKSLHFFKGSMAFEVDPYLSSRHIKMQVIIVLQTASNNTEFFFIPV